MLLAQFSISALNDWADRDRDARAGRSRPVAVGLVSRPTALALSILFALAAAALGVLSGLGWGVTLLVLAGIAAGWAYDLGVKVTPFSFLPFAVGFPLLPLWVGLISGRTVPSLLALFLGGMPLATAIHLADAVPDRAADAASGANTLAVALGRPAAELVAVGSLWAGCSALAIATFVARPVDAVATIACGLAGGLLYGRLVLARDTPADPTSRWILVAAALLAALLWIRGS